MTALATAQPFQDKTHFSKVFNENRNYRILLPPGYAAAGDKRYPVIYYHHGHSDRYTVERYDEGKDTIPKMAAFVASHDVIVVCVDGYVARDYTGFYGGSPWDIREDGGDYDFGAYFLELAAHIDSTYRTLADRRHRGVSGLSMGGFMALWLSARYPDRIGSASAFNPGPEFYLGDKGRRSLWRPKDHVMNHAQTMVRLVRASGDYISQYHEETRDAYARAGAVDFEYRQDEYHRHWATSIGETFAFHWRAFGSPHLGNVPDAFNHTSPQRSFEVWGYKVDATLAGAGITYLEKVSQGGLRVTTRRWAPDGPPAAGDITITTAPLYKAGQMYRMLDYDLLRGKSTSTDLRASADGRLQFKIDGGGHQICFAGPGAGGQPPVVLPLTGSDRLRLWPDRSVSLPVRIYNPRVEPLRDVKLALTSEYPTVKIEAGSATIGEIGAGESRDLSGQLRLRLTSGGGYFAPARLLLKITYDAWHEATETIDVLVVPSVMPGPAAVEILDGRRVTLPVFRQKGNQGGGAPLDRTVTEGKGNGNGILEPGEEATIWVKMAQGMDAFDKNTWRRAKVYADSPHLEEIGDIQEQKQLEWTGAKERTSLVRMSAGTPAGTAIPVLLDCESWSYHFTPEVRYGRQQLYQALQLHRRHLFPLELRAR